MLTKCCFPEHEYQRMLKNLITPYYFFIIINTNVILYKSDSTHFCLFLDNVNIFLPKYLKNAR